MPGMTDTPMAVEASLADEGHPTASSPAISTRRSATRRCRWPARGRPSTPAYAALYLACGESRYVSGTAPAVDGAMGRQLPPILGSPNMGMLDGQVAIVTGSTSGIGRAIAERFAEEGARLVINSVKSVEAGQKLAAELPDAIYVQADVSSDEQCRSLVDGAMGRWGQLDIVVNNAGAAVMLDHGMLDEHTDDVWRQMIDVNLLGPWCLSRAAVAPMRAAGGGSIVNISSLAGVHPTSSGSCIGYGVAKAGLNHLTVLLANVLAQDNIRVNSVAVGPIETPMWGLAADEIRAHRRPHRPRATGNAGRGGQLLPDVRGRGLRDRPGARGGRRDAVPGPALGF
jgi:ketoreductase RED2